MVLRSSSRRTGLSSRSPSSAHSLSGQLTRFTSIGTLPLWVAAISALGAHGSYAEQAKTMDEEVVVTATATRHTLDSAPASISLITPDDIQKLPVKDLGDVLKQTAGVAVSTVAGGRNSLYLRGLDEGYILMLVDGKRVSSSNGLWRGGNFDLTSIPLDSIARVEVVRGPMSALYGSDAVGGVINIITKAPEDDWQVNANTEYSQMQEGDGGDRYRANVYASGKLHETLGAIVSLESARQERWQDDTLTPDYDSVEERKTLKLNSTLRWQMTEQQSLDVDYAHNQDDVPPTNYGGATREQTLDRNTIGVKHSGAWQWGTTQVLANREHSRIYDYNSRYFAQPPLGRDIQETNTTLRGTAQFALNQHSVTLGSEYLNTEVEDPVQYPAEGGDETRLASVFAQDEYQMLPSLMMTVGLRYEDSDKFGDQLSPRIYFVHNTSDFLTLKGGVGTAFRAPSLFESSPTFASVSCRGLCVINGNADLSPETSVNTEFSAIMNGDTWRTAITIFHNTIDDLINVGAWDGQAASRSYYNEADVTIQGVEIEGDIALGDHWTIKPSYNWLDTEDTDGDVLAYRPRHTGAVTVDWQATNALKSYMTFTYFGTHTNSAGLTQRGYRQVNLGASYALSDQFSIRLGMTNIGNEQPVEKDPASETILQGRAVFAGLSFQLR